VYGADVPPMYRRLQPRGATISSVSPPSVGLRSSHIGAGSLSLGSGFGRRLVDVGALLAVPGTYLGRYCRITLAELFDDIGGDRSFPVPVARA